MLQQTVSGQNTSKMAGWVAHASAGGGKYIQNFYGKLR
jgi:hypothetical protein